MVRNIEMVGRKKSKFLHLIHINIHEYLLIFLFCLGVKSEPILCKVPVHVWLCLHIFVNVCVSVYACMCMCIRMCVHLTYSWLWGYYPINFHILACMGQLVPNSNWPTESFLHKVHFQRMLILWTGSRPVFLKLS